MKEQIFFDDENLDRIFGVVFALAAEVYILKDRNSALEKLLAEKGVLSNEEIENFGDSINTAERDEFITRILEPIIYGGLASSSVGDEFQIN